MRKASRKTVIGDFAVSSAGSACAAAKPNMPETLLMLGSDDLIVSKEQLKPSAALWGAEMLTPDAGHLPMLEQPGPFVAALRDFVQSVR